MDLVSLAAALFLVDRFVVGVPLAAGITLAAGALLMPLRPALGQPTPLSEFLAALPRRLVATIAAAAVLRFVLNQPLHPLWVCAVWPAIAWAFVFDWSRVRIRSPAGNELLRVSLLAAGALWLMRGFETRSLNGTPDALWYGTMLADMVAQVRSGVFPVWLGQSIYQFNGAIYPLRVAPAFHYLGALLDIVTFRSLGVFALQNLLITLTAVGTLFTAYLGLCALLPGRRWLAAGLSALFLSCPGVLGIAYNTDLYMSWTTLPLVTLAWFATVRSFEDRGALSTLLLLGFSLGLTWWGHSPIALWSTLLAGAAQAVRVYGQRRDGVAWKPILAGALTFAAVAAYPVGSVLLFPPEPGVHADSFQAATAGTIVYFLQQAFPSTVLPMSAMGRSLGDFQLGYALWAVLLFCLWGQRRQWKPIYGVPLALAAVLAILLLPLPGFDLAIWSLIPSFVRNTTGNWVMNRLYLPLAAATVFGAAAGISSGSLGAGRRRIVFAVLVAAGCVWSFAEAAKFAFGSRERAHTDESAVDMLRPENVQITRFSYLVFPALPDTFTHGVADPSMENRLLSKEAMAPVASNKAAAAEGLLQDTVQLRWAPGELPDRVEADKAVQIEPDRFYLLDFTFPSPDALHGVLQLTGSHFFREYELPEYGGPEAFGAGASHSHAMSVWTTSGPERLAVKFFPESKFPADSPAVNVATIRLLSYDRAQLPVVVDGWIPYRAHVRSPEAVWLETPRMYQTGYQASVNGQPAAVRKSPEGLVCVAVPQGLSTVELAYSAPVGLRILFWLSAASIAVGSALGLWTLILHLLGRRTHVRASATASAA